MRMIRALVGLVGAAVLLLAVPAAAAPAAVTGTATGRGAVTGHWESAGHLAVTRDAPLAVVLDDGRVLIAGGTAARGRSSEIYDPVTGRTTVTSPTRLSRLHASMVRLKDGRVLLAGGIAVAAGQPVQACEIFDPVTQKWSLVAPMNRARSDFSMTLLRSGRVLVAGGFSGTTFGAPGIRAAEVYDPDRDEWVSIAPTRWRHAASPWLQSTAVLPDGDVLLFGASFGNPGRPNRPERFDVDTRTWAPAGEVAPLRAPGLVRLAGEQVLAVQGRARGRGPSAPVYRYVPTLDEWRHNSDLPDGFPLGAVVSSRNRPLALGACKGDPTRPCGRVARYLPGPRRWVPAAPMPDRRSSYAAVTLHDGSVLVVGGHYQVPKTEARPIARMLRWYPAGTRA